MKPPKILYDDNTQQWIDFTDENTFIYDKSHNLIGWKDKSGNNNHLWKNEINDSPFLKRKELITRKISDDEKSRSKITKYLKKKWKKN
jgi:hypothetical protein